MVSRRRILSRSRDDLNLYHSFVHEDEEDVWYQKEKLFREHIQEVLDKWNQIDDEIWAKIIVFERNRRVAKAYARTPILTVNGSDDGFDGMKIGLCGFENPMRDRKIEEIKRNVGQGVKLRMDDDGNISVRRYSKSNVYVKSTASSPNEDISIGNDILKLPSNCLELEKIAKIFDMKKFQANINRELRRAYPDRKKLETQCLSVIAFGRMEVEILDCPVWILIVNVVAMDMLKCKIPPIQRPFDISNRPKISLPDEDPYTVLENGEESSGSASSGFGTSAASSGYVISPRDKSMMQSQYVRRNERPPKLPPRDNFYAHNLPKPDYDDFDVENRLKPHLRGRADKNRDNVQKYDDPYYCGLRARVCIPKTKVRKTVSNDDSSLYSSGSFFQKPKTKEEMLQERFRRNMDAPAPFSSLNQLHLMQYSNNNDIYSQPQQTSYIPRSNMMKQQRYMWHRSFESGIDIEVTENPYGHIYGRLPLPPPRRRYLSSGPTTMYVGEWE